ncbi:hypothetical protein LPC08_23235 [Roseomonas sp. OT10]|uniref:hypothetical protein n=1 Tax=Roseomonas cutis TaxID=2897332 RepID=UPI001E5CB42D|nr:hypothetical protein [Roseomonas sp. OT10]UFN48875.1 hypothetical protein LPC08_23235 [Roseomonas sp. OT10]
MSPTDAPRPEPLSPGEEALRRLFGPARHAANNLALVLLMNLEGAAGTLPEGSREARQVGRALEAARAYDGLVRGLLALTRPETVVPVVAEDWLREILPLLGLATGKPMRLEVTGERVRVAVARPRMDAVLVGMAAARPAAAEAVVRLEGARVSVAWGNAASAGESPGTLLLPAED